MDGSEAGVASQNEDVVRDDRGVGEGIEREDLEAEVELAADRVKMVAGTGRAHLRMVYVINSVSSLFKSIHNVV